MRNFRIFSTFFIHENGDKSINNFLLYEINNKKLTRLV